jgi:tripartite-type tricarboxylate transporter receptor subunit TctC
MMAMTCTLTALGLLIALAAAGNAEAKSYPARPIRLIVVNAAGSSLDIVNRIVAGKLSDALGQQMVVDNRAGAGGTVGTAIAARATPDGYTLMAAGPSSMINSRFVYRKLAYDVLKDFDPVASTANAEAVFVVHPGLPAKNVKEFIAFAKAQPGRLNMASAGIGSSSHLAGVMFINLAGIESIHVPYKGGGPSAASVVAGESQWTITPIGAVFGHVKAGRLRALAISSKTRSPMLPELPTIDEAGVPGYEFFSWNGFFAPRGTPRAIVNSLHAATQKVLAEPDTKQLLAGQGVLPLESASPEEFARFFRADFDRVAKLISIAGIKPE